MQIYLHAISQQDSTMESINLSGNPARLDPDALQIHFQTFEFIRKLNLSNAYRRSGSDPLMAASVLHSWKLEEIQLNHTSLNQRDIAEMCIYLRSSQSDTLRQVGFNGCNLTGAQIAEVMRAMYRGVGNIRPIHLHITKNRLEESHVSFVEAVRQSMTPCAITMQMQDYKEERHFREFVDALANNTSLVFLDISKASLPSDAGSDTCAALENMFSENRTLEELDISGEQTHLDAASLGIGLNRALMGLRKNTTLCVLRVENQGLGFQGASTIASVLEENQGLRHIHCENNEFGLQAFTILVKSLKQNFTLLYLPQMDEDRIWSLRRIQRELDNSRESSTLMNLNMNMSMPGKATVRKTFGAAMSGQRSNRPAKTAQSAVVTSKDAQAAVAKLAANWDVEVSKLKEYLERNYNLIYGAPSLAPSYHERPATAVHDSSLEGTPTCEADLQLGQKVQEIKLQENDEPGSSPDEQETDEALMLGEKLDKL